MKCMCGCQQETPIATKTDSRRKIVKGKPLRFLPGHNSAARKEPGFTYLTPVAAKKGVVNAFAANNRRVGEGREVSIISRISHASRDLWL